MVFGKRMQVSGFFSAEKDGARDVNMAGAQLGLRQFAVIKEQLQAQNIIANVQKVGQTLGTNVARSCEKSKRITGVRTVGTSSWIDTADSDSARALCEHLRKNGVLVKLNGARGVMTKPALTLHENQAAPLASALAKF